MPYCEESIVAKLDPEGASHFCQHNLVLRKTQLCLMRVQSLSLIWEFQKIALKIVLLILLLAKFLQKIPMSRFDSVSDINTESAVDHDNNSECPNIEMSSPLSQREGTLDCDTVSSAKAEVCEFSEPSPPPIQVRRSTRSTKGKPPIRYGSVVSHREGFQSKFGKWLSSISKKVDSIYDHMFD